MPGRVKQVPQDSTVLINIYTCDIDKLIILNPSSNKL